MTRRIGWLGWGLCVAWTVTSANASASERDWHIWRPLPVQDGGRVKPFDSLARDLLRKMTGRESIPDPDSGEQLEPVAAYLSMVFTWQGWDGPTRAGSVHAQRPANPYFGRHTGDSWDQLPLLPVPQADLRELLSLPRGTRAIAPYALSQAKMEVPESHEQRSFVSWAERLGQKDVDERTTLERHAWELMQRYWEYQRHRMGDRLLVAPSRDATRSRWLSLSEIVSGSFDENSDPAGTLRAVQQSFAAARQSQRGAPPEVQAAALESLRHAFSELNALDDNSPQATALRWEVWSNRWRPLRWSWVCLLLAAMLLGLGALTKSVWCDRCGWGLYTSGCLAMCVGVAVRVFVSGRWLGANMYESVVLVGGAVVLLGLLGALFQRSGICLFAGASTGALFLGFTDVWVGTLDPSLQPLPLALQDTLWFVAHGVTNSLGFAFLALSAAISNVQLALLLGRHAPPTCGSLALLLERTARWGTMWLAAGLITGALWAERAWGRFWSWDPKETWTLLALLAYLAAQHARSARWWQAFGTAAGNTLCFQLVLSAWLGINGATRSSAHDYGSSAGLGAWMLAAMVVQMLVLVAAGVRVAWHAHQAREARRLGM